MRDFIVNTKVGHFLFLITFCFAICGIVSLLTKMELSYMMLGSFLTSIVISVIDGNERWV